MPTISEKILGRTSGEQCSAGEFVKAGVDFAMAHDGTSVLAERSMRKMGVEEVWNPERVIVPFDHIAPASTEMAARLQKKIRGWARGQGMHFYDVGEGICHQLVLEEGFALPGKLVVGADSHSCTYGAFGAFGTGVGATDMAEILASGEVWFRVPETIRVEVENTLPEGSTAKDLTLEIVGELGIDGATYKTLEFYGLEWLEMAGRMTLCNMAVETGAKAGIVPPDRKTERYLRGRAREEYEPVYSDPDAEYVDEYGFDARVVGPRVARPHRVEDVVAVEEVEGTPVDQVFIGSCTNGRLEDLRAAARMLKDEKVRVRTIAIPASRRIMLDAIEEGIVSDLLRAGVTVCNPGCGPCLGAHMGTLGEDEVCLSTANRNFPGRMGYGGYIYLASPVTAAATALTGEIADPRDFL